MASQLSIVAVPMSKTNNLCNKGERKMGEFKPKRTIQSVDLHISARAASVFPLLCPVREFDWIESWDCDLVYSDSGVAENNCVFQTDRPGEGKRTWVVSRYEPDRFIEFVIFQQDSVIIKLDIALSENEDGTTGMNIRHTMTGLSHNGNRLIDNLPPDYIRKRWEFLARALNHYLKTGTMLRSSE